MTFLIFSVCLALGVLLLIALSYKWCLSPGKSALLIISATLVATTIGAIAWFIIVIPIVVGIIVIFCQLGIYLSELLYLFYRDPIRTPPDNPNAIVSPADGKVIYIKKLESGTLLQSEKNKDVMILDELREKTISNQYLWQIGISMSFTDVHINRAPVAGQVTMISKHPGKFLSLRKREAVNTNERQTLVIENGKLQIAIVQIASRLVRQIQAFIRQGDMVEKGQRIGIIKFGSQVDLFLPVELSCPLNISLGQHLVAGQTVISSVQE